MRQIFLLVPMLMLTLASSAWAQVTRDGARPDNTWLTPAAAVILGGFVVAVSIKKAKRDHRD